MDQIAVLLEPGHVPDRLGGSYEDACAALELPPVPGGYALYLFDQMNQRMTVVSTGTSAAREAIDAYNHGGDGDMQRFSVAADEIADIREGWPEEFGGGPRCQFCRDPHPAWIYEGADVEVLLGEPLLGFKGEPRPVIGSDVVGCTDWHACGICHDLIETATLAAWLGLLDRYGDPDVPMPVQSAWREFWANHRPPEPADPPEWTPGRRRRMAYEIAVGWDAFTAANPVDEILYTDDPDVPEHAGADAALEAARAYLRQPPPAGRIRVYPAVGGGAIVRADGDGWSLVGRTGSVAFMLLDTDPYTARAISWKSSPSFLEKLSDLAAPGI
jgi:hypothetical protein